MATTRISWQRVFKLYRCRDALDDGQLPHHPPSHQSDPGLGRLLPEHISKIERRENVRNKFSSRLEAKVPGVYLRAEVAEGRRALCR